MAEADADSVATEVSGDAKDDSVLPYQNTSPFCCHPCQEDGEVVFATFICRTCSEFYCDGCAKDHRYFKATKAHNMVNLQNKIKCEPCSNKGVNPEFSSHYCIECDEWQCEGCAKKDKELKSTRGHVAVHTLETALDVRQNQEADSDQTRGNSVINTRPGKPYVISKTLDSITIRWNPPTELFKENSYQLRYRENNTNGKWRFAQEAFTETTRTLRNLQSGTQFVFQVRMFDNENEGPYSELSDPVETTVSAAERHLPIMQDVTSPKDGMKLKRLPFQENMTARNEGAKTRTLRIGQGGVFTTKEKTILLIGAAGTGKSTMVDAMINYILGVTWEDDYRLTVVGGDENHQAESQTKLITCYEINPFIGGRLKYKLNVIDTPGFSDTQGSTCDKQFIDQLHHLSNSSGIAGVSDIDAICFIVKAQDARLTASLKNIFDSIMTLFGKDIPNNVLTLITFADGMEPPVLAALKEATLPHEEYYLFNNSGLYASNAGSANSRFGSMFWNMGHASFDRFFGRLAQLETQILSQTKDAKQQKERLEKKVGKLLPLLNQGLAKIEDLRCEMNILVKHKAQIMDNNDFKYTVEDTKINMVPTPPGRNTTTCLICNFTCHDNCSFADDADKKRCTVMKSNGYCSVCVAKCRWDAHKNVPYYFELVKVKHEKTYDVKLHLYRIATDDKEAVEKVIKEMNAEICGIENDILVLMGDINECNNELRKIVQKLEPLSLVDHINFLIESEKQQKRPDFIGRIQSLEECRKRATVDKDVSELETRH